MRLSKEYPIVPRYTYRYTWVIDGERSFFMKHTQKRARGHSKSCQKIGLCLEIENSFVYIVQIYNAYTWISILLFFSSGEN